MKTTRKSSWLLPFVLVACICVAGWALGQVRRTQDTSDMAEVTEKTRPICVGRFLVDVPTQAEVGLSCEMIAGLSIKTVEEGEPAFRERIATREADASPDEMLRVTKLRTGKRDINEMPGEEVLERVREFNFATIFGFTWETEGAKDNPLQPFLSLELQSGISPQPGAKPADASLHEDAVLALWDAISSSIRLPPIGPRPPAGLAADERTLRAASPHP